MSHSGVPVATLYLKANASVSDVTIITKISKVSSGGSKTALSTKTSSSQSLGTSYAAKTNTHASLTATVASTFNLELNVTIGGSNSGDLTYTLAYDVATYKSKMALKVTDPLTATVTSDQTSYKYREQATMTVTVTDIWGGYDIASAPTVTFSAPGPGLSGATTALSTGNAQYSNTYTWTFTPMEEATKYGYPLGDWTSTATVSDNSGNSYTSSSYSFAWERQDPTGSNPPPDQPLQLPPSYGNILIIGAIVAVVAIIWSTQRKRKVKRRKRRR